MGEKTSKDISSRSTKNEILKAYEEMLSKYEDGAAKAADKKAEVKAIADKKVLEKATSYTLESIVKGFADLKLKIGKSLTELSEQLTEEANKLTEIKQAIAIETKNLEEIHNIKIAADTLADLIRAQEERKSKFEADMAEQEERFKSETLLKKTAWEKEKKEYEQSVKERDISLKKERDREKEEYEYNLTLARKKDKDIYESKKAELEKELEEKRITQEKELTEREAAIVTREKEFAELKEKVEKFPDELSDTVKNAEKAAANEVENKAKVEAQLLRKGVEGEKKLAELKISSLEETIAKQNTQVQELTKQLHEATAQVQGVAVKVIEGISDAKALGKVNEIALEQAKNINIKR